MQLELRWTCKKMVMVGKSQRGCNLSEGYHQIRLSHAHLKLVDIGKKGTKASMSLFTIVIRTNQQISPKDIDCLSSNIINLSMIQQRLILVLPKKQLPFAIACMAYVAKINPHVISVIRVGLERSVIFLKRKEKE